MSDKSSAYQRGYYAGMRRLQRRVDRILEIAKGIRTRADEGMGNCSGCRYFHRHEATHWGTCAASSDADVTRTFSKSVAWFRPEKEGPLNVGEDFGCVHWAAKGRK